MTSNFRRFTSIYKGGQYKTQPRDCFCIKERSVSRIIAFVTRVSIKKTVYIRILYAGVKKQLRIHCLTGYGESPIYSLNI